MNIKIILVNLYAIPTVNLINWFLLEEIAGEIEGFETFSLLRSIVVDLWAFQ